MKSIANHVLSNVTFSSSPNGKEVRTTTSVVEGWRGRAVIKVEEREGRKVLMFFETVNGLEVNSFTYGWGCREVPSEVRDFLRWWFYRHGTGRDWHLSVDLLLSRLFSMMM